MSWRERQAQKEREGATAGTPPRTDSNPRPAPEPVDAAPSEGRRRLNLAPRTLPKPDLPAAQPTEGAAEERRAPATGGAYRPPAQRGAAPASGSPAPYRRPGADREAPASGVPPYRRGDREGAPPPSKEGDEAPKKYVPPSQRQGGSGGWRK